MYKTVASIEEIGAYFREQARKKLKKSFLIKFLVMYLFY